MRHSAFSWMHEMAETRALLVFLQASLESYLLSGGHRLATAKLADLGPEPRQRIRVGPAVELKADEECLCCAIMIRRCSCGAAASE